MFFPLLMCLSRPGRPLLGDLWRLIAKAELGHASASLAWAKRVFLADAAATRRFIEAAERHHRRCVIAQAYAALSYQSTGVVR